jgi:hypothetical protein
MTKIAGSGSGSRTISQRHGSADPDPKIPYHYSTAGETGERTNWKLLVDFLQNLKQHIYSFRLSRIFVTNVSRFWTSTMMPTSFQITSKRASNHLGQKPFFAIRTKIYIFAALQTTFKTKFI